MLGGDHDHAVGAAGTIERVRGCILQDTDALHILRVDVTVIAGIGQSVKDDERCTAGIDTAHATDAYGRITGGGVIAFHHLHTCDFSIDGLNGIADLSLADVIAVEHAGRARETFTFLFTESYHDDVIEALLVRRECDLHLGFDGHFLRLHAHISNHQSAGIGRKI